LGGCVWRSMAVEGGEMGKGEIAMESER